MKEQGVDVVFGTWRGLMSQKQASDAERKELADAIAEDGRDASLEGQSRKVRLA